MSAEDPFATLARRHAGERPDARVPSFLDPQLEVVESLTYRERDDRARSVAAQVPNVLWAGLIRDTKLGIETGRQGRSSGDAFTAEQIDALDERELTELPRRRIDDVLDGGPS